MFRSTPSDGSSDDLGKKQTPSKLTLTIPVPKKTGNKQVDDAQAHGLLCLRSAIEDLINIEAIRAKTFAFIHTEKLALAKMAGVSRDAVTFDGASSIHSIDDEFKINFITSHSDISSSDLIAVAKEDASALDMLCQHALQLPFRQSLPPPFQVKEVCLKFWNERQGQCGKRLESFKAKGGLKPDSTLNFSGETGSYKLSFDSSTKMLTAITHVASATQVAVNPKLCISTAYALYDNNDDQSACLVQAPLPPVKLASFFDKKAKQGPWTYPSYHGAPKEMEKVAQAFYKEYSQEREARTAAAGDKAVKTALEKHKQDKQKEQMNKARQQAKEALAAKKRKRAVSLEELAA